MTEPTHEYHDRVREDVFPLLPAVVGRVLDIGGGIGATSLALKSAGRASEVVLVDQMAAAHLDAIDRGYAGNIDNPDLIDEVLRNHAPFDTILCLDILEHLQDPWSLVRHLHRGLAPGGSMVISLPNMNHSSLVLPLLFRGRFELEDAGLLDRTHLRWFTRESAIDLATCSGLTLEAIRPNIFRRKHKLLNRLTLRTLERFFALQYVMRARNGRA